MLLGLGEGLPPTRRRGSALAAEVRPAEFAGEPSPAAAALPGHSLWRVVLLQQSVLLPERLPPAAPVLLAGLHRIWLAFAPSHQG